MLLAVTFQLMWCEWLVILHCHTLGPGIQAGHWWMDVSASQLTLIKLNSSFQITTLIIPGYNSEIPSSIFNARHLEQNFLNSIHPCYKWSDVISDIMMEDETYFNLWKYFRSGRSRRYLASAVCGVHDQQSELWRLSLRIWLNFMSALVLSRY